MTAQPYEPHQRGAAGQGSERPPISTVPTRGLLAAYEADGAGGAGADRDALERDPAEVDLDRREAVAAVEEAGCGQAGAGRQRLDEAVQPRAQAAEQPLRLVQVLVGLRLHALARRAADARTHLGHDLERALMVAGCGLVVALFHGVGEGGELLGHAAAAGDQDLAPVGDVGDADARSAPVPAQAQEREHEHDGAGRGEHPHPGARTRAGRGRRGGGEGGGGKGGRGERTGSRGALPGRARGGDAARHERSVGAPGWRLVLQGRDL